LFPQADYKSQSLAYPQISKIDVPYYLTNTAYAGVNAPRAYASNKSLPCFEKHGLLAPHLSYKIETYPLIHTNFKAQKSMSKK
ncbi:MAG: hypothetical protein ABIO44_10035, partial [Saprospiraceae bacterium]